MLRSLCLFLLLAIVPLPAQESRTIERGSIIEDRAARKLLQAGDARLELGESVCLANPCARQTPPEIRVPGRQIPGSVSPKLLFIGKVRHTLLAMKTLSALEPMTSLLFKAGGISLFCPVSALIGHAAETQSQIMLKIDEHASLITHDLAVTLFGQNATSSEMSGMILVDLTYDDLTGQISRFQYSGGLIRFAPTTLTLPGLQGTTLSLDFEEIQAVPQSPEGAELLLNPVGILDADRHLFTPTAGVLNVNTLSNGMIVATQPIDVTNPTPNDLLDSDAIGVTDSLQISLSPVPATAAHQGGWQVGLTGSGSSGGSDTSQGLTVDYETTTNLKADGFIGELTDWGQWLTREGLSLETLPGATNLAGQLYGLLYAFDLNQGSARLPLEMSVFSENQIEITISCPEDGLRAAVSLKETRGLKMTESGNLRWRGIPGTKGRESILIPRSERGFFFFSMDD